MGTLAQTVLPFKLEATEELLTANAGLALFGEFVRGLGFSRWLAQEMPKPGSGRGYEADAYVTPLVLMLDLRRSFAGRPAHAQGRYGAGDGAQTRDTAQYGRRGDWLRRTGEDAGLAGLVRINQRIVAARVRQSGITAHTLDGDASQIVAEKEAAQFTYKGEQGYTPMIGHLAEAGVVIHDEFREGNIAPATDNLGFIQACEARIQSQCRLLPHRCHRAQSVRPVQAFRPGRGLAAPHGGHRALAPVPSAGQGGASAGAWVLKVATAALDLFRSIRTRSFALAQAMSP